jgi:hypothetical protein
MIHADGRPPWQAGEPGAEGGRSGGGGVGDHLKEIIGAERVVVLSRVADLCALSEEEFRKVVMAEAKEGSDPLTALALRHPDLQVRWLKDLKAGIEIPENLAKRIALRLLLEPRRFPPIGTAR